MKKIYLAAMAVAALTVSSCSQDEVLNINPEAGAKAIEFGVYTGKTAQTRGTGTTTATVAEDGFGVSAVWTQGTATGTTWTSAVPNFMYNRKVYSDNTSTPYTWKYTPVQYWPKTSGEKISFFAWGPYGADGISIKGASEVANQLDFTVQDKASKMVDFVATSAMNVDHYDEATNTTHDKVSFNLKHELTRINFTAVASETLWDDTGNKNKTKIVIKKIELSGFNKLPSKGTYTFDCETINPSTHPNYIGSWSLSNETTEKLALDGEYDLLNDEDDKLDIWNSTTVSFGISGKEYKLGENKKGIVVTSKTTATNLFKDNHYLFLLPIASSGLTDGAVKVKFTYDIVTIDNKLSKKYIATEHTHEVSLTSGTMLQGKAYNYKFTFDVHAVTVAATTTVDEWGTSAENQ